MTPEARVTVVKDMAVTHAEFARGIGRLVPARGNGRDPATGSPVMQIPWSGGVVEVNLEPETTRRLGMMSIPRTRVVLTFTGLSREERDDFIQQFDRRFQRGGG